MEGKSDAGNVVPGSPMKQSRSFPAATERDSGRNGRALEVREATAVRVIQSVIP